MKSLPLTDAHHLRAAQGWLELGNYSEANEELEKITPLLRAHPDVLELRWHIYVKAKKWDYALAVAEGMAENFANDPRGAILLCKTLYFTSRIQQAYDLAAQKLPCFLDSWEFFYDFACYACLLGKRQQAELALQKAMELGDAKKVKLLALDDPDLKTLFQSAE